MVSQPSLDSRQFVLLTFVTGANSIYKKSISANPFYGSTAKLAGYIPNTGGPDMIREAVDSLNQGRDLVIFPEGTRSTHFNKELVKPGFSLIAKRAEAEIKLLWSDHPEDFLTREVPIFGLPKMRAFINIEQFDSIQATRNSSVKELTQQVSEAFERKCNSMRHSEETVKPASLIAQAKHERLDDSTVTFSFVVPEDLPQFEGHFPDQPIVPGITQISWCINAIETSESLAVSNYKLSRFKFTKPIVPNDSIVISMSKKDLRFSFKISSNQENAASGNILLK